MQMLIKWLGGLAAIWGAAIGLSAGKAQDAQPLKPAGKWIVDYQEQLCVASRAFVSDGGTLTLAFRPFPTNTRLDIALIDTHDQLPIEQKGTGALTLGPSGQTVTADVSSFGLGNGKRILHLYVDRDQLTQLAASRALSIDADGRKLALGLTSMGGVLKILADCEQGVIRSWGVDPALFSAAAVPPKPITSPGSWFGFGDYPIEAIAAGEQGRVVALIAVDSKGKVSDCRVVESAKSKSLDQTSCVVGRRGRFHPALDAAGNPIQSWYLLPVRWRLPTPTDKDRLNLRNIGPPR